MRAVVFEGGPLEIVEALKAMGVTSVSTPVALDGSSAVSGNETPNEERREASKNDGEERGLIVISTRFARKVLTRRGLSPLQRKMLAEIYNAGEVGILGTELAAKLDYEPAQFRGMMGAWGRRLANTPGYDGEGHFFTFEWDYEAGSYRYWLPVTVREAVRIEIIE